MTRYSILLLMPMMAFGAGAPAQSYTPHSTVAVRGIQKMEQGLAETLGGLAASVEKTAQHVDVTIDRATQAVDNSIARVGMTFNNSTKGLFVGSVGFGLSCLGLYGLYKTCNYCWYHATTPRPPSSDTSKSHFSWKPVIWGGVSSLAATLGGLALVLKSDSLVNKFSS